MRRLLNLFRRDTWTVEGFTDEAGRPRWRIVAENGQTVATSGESYSSVEKRDQTARRATKVCLVLGDLPRS